MRQTWTIGCPMRDRSVCRADGKQRLFEDGVIEEHVKHCGICRAAFGIGCRRRFRLCSRTGLRTCGRSRGAHSATFNLDIRIHERLLVGGDSGFLPPEPFGVGLEASLANSSTFCSETVWASCPLLDATEQVQELFRTLMPAILISTLYSETHQACRWYLDSCFDELDKAHQRSIYSPLLRGHFELADAREEAPKVGVAAQYGEVLGPSVGQETLFIQPMEQIGAQSVEGFARKCFVSFCGASRTRRRQASLGVSRRCPGSTGPGSSAPRSASSPSTMSSRRPCAR